MTQFLNRWANHLVRKCNKIMTETIHQHHILSLGQFKLQRLYVSVFFIGYLWNLLPLFCGARVVLILVIVFYYYIDICCLPSFSNIVIKFMICQPVFCNDYDKIDFFYFICFVNIPHLDPYTIIILAILLECIVSVNYGFDITLLTYIL